MRITLVQETEYLSIRWKGTYKKKNSKPNKNKTHYKKILDLVVETIDLSIAELCLWIWYSPRFFFFAVFSDTCSSTKSWEYVTKEFFSVWDLWNSNSNLEFHWFNEVLKVFNLCIVYSFEMQYLLLVQNLLVWNGCFQNWFSVPHWNHANKIADDKSIQNYDQCNTTARTEVNAVQWLGSEAKQMEVLLHIVSN